MQSEVLARLKAIIADAEADMAEHFSDAKETGERADLADAEVCLLVDDAKAIVAALSAAGPVAWVVKRYDLEGVLLDTELSFVRPTIKSTCRTEMVPLDAAPPAPSVAVKALPELCPCGDVMRGGRCQCGSISTAEPRIPSAEQERLRFEGDLDKWMKILGAGITGYQPEAYAVMDAACAELVKMRTLSAQVQGVAGDEEWQIVPKHPTGSMIEAVVSMVDDDAPHLFLLNLYRAMLAAAPAKQEG